MKRFLVVFGVCFLNLTVAFSQQVTINGEVGRLKLNWSDFIGTVDRDSRFAAATYWNVNYSYKGVVFRGDSAVLKDLVVDLKLNPEKSWSKKEFQSDELLQHEQGHFYFGRLCQLEFLETVHRTSLDRSTFREKINATFQEVINKYKELELKYDEETDHYKNKTKQAEWNKFLNDELKRFEGSGQGLS